MFHTFYHIYLSFVLSTHLHHLSSTVWIHYTIQDVVYFNVILKSGKATFINSGIDNGKRVWGSGGGMHSDLNEPLFSYRRQTGAYR